MLDRRAIRRCVNVGPAAQESPARPATPRRHHLTVTDEPGGRPPVPRAAGHRRAHCAACAAALTGPGSLPTACCGWSTPPWRRRCGVTVALASTPRARPGGFGAPGLHVRHRRRAGMAAVVVPAPGSCRRRSPRCQHDVVRTWPGGWTTGARRRARHRACGRGGARCRGDHRRRCRYEGQSHELGVTVRFACRAPPPQFIRPPGTPVRWWLRSPAAPLSPGMVADRCGKPAVVAIDRTTGPRLAVTRTPPAMPLSSCGGHAVSVARSGRPVVPPRPAVAHDGEAAQRLRPQHQGAPLGRPVHRRWHPVGAGRAHPAHGPRPGGRRHRRPGDRRHLASRCSTTRRRRHHLNDITLRPPCSPTPDARRLGGCPSPRRRRCRPRLLPRRHRDPAGGLRSRRFCSRPTSPIIAARPAPRPSAPATDAWVGEPPGRSVAALPTARSTRRWPRRARCAAG